jgi:hypothetical protein
MPPSLAATLACQARQPRTDKRRVTRTDPSSCHGDGLGEHARLGPFHPLLEVRQPGLHLAKGGISSGDRFQRDDDANS